MFLAGAVAPAKNINHLFYNSILLLFKKRILVKLVLSQRGKSRVIENHLVKGCRASQQSLANWSPAATRILEKDAKAKPLRDCDF